MGRRRKSGVTLPSRDETVVQPVKWIQPGNENAPPEDGRQREKQRRSLKQDTGKHEQTCDAGLKHQCWILKGARLCARCFESLLLDEVDSDVRHRRTSRSSRAKRFDFCIKSDKALGNQADVVAQALGDNVEVPASGDSLVADLLTESLLDGCQSIVDGCYTVIHDSKTFVERGYTVVERSYTVVERSYTVVERS
jgi:hypothetical protein